MQNIGIIGSGPAGATAAYKALALGHKVTMLDFGNLPPTEASQLMNRKNVIEPDDFLRVVHANRAKSALGKKLGVPEKLAFGSTFPYDSVLDKNLHFAKSVEFVTSYALGGLSNAWGATVSAMHAQDISNWPFPSSDFDKYYKSLSEIIEISSGVDDLDQLYPLPISSGSNFEIGSQGRKLLDYAKQNREILARDGIYIGRAKLAVGKKYASNGIGCINCGLCMHGCPYNAIFNSAFLVEELKQNQNFSYLGNLFVKRFSETSSQVSVVCDEKAGGEKSFVFDRLFIGAGVISSTKLVHNSLGWKNNSYKIKDSQKYLFPFFLNQRVKGAVKEQSNTLSQVYLEFKNKEISNRLVHMQLYGYNDLVIEPIAKILPRFIAKQIPSIFSGIFDRLMIGMVYLHSDDSGSFDYKVSEGLENSLGSVEGDLSQRGRDVFKGLRALISKNKHLIGGVISPLGIQEVPCGKSQHFGSSMPISASPVEGQTDLIGRPFGCERVHVVDASVFPSMPGTPTTFPIMANASRIVTEILTA